MSSIAAVHTCVVAKEESTDSCSARERKHVGVAEELHVPLPRSVQQPGAPGNGHVDRHSCSGQAESQTTKTSPKSNPPAVPRRGRGIRQAPPNRLKSNLYYPARCKFTLRNQKQWNGRTAGQKRGDPGNGRKFWNRCRTRVEIRETFGQGRDQYLKPTTPVLIRRILFVAA